MIEPGTPQIEGASDLSSASISSFSSGARAEMRAVNAQLEAEFERDSGLRLHYPAQATDLTQRLADSTASDEAESPSKEVCCHGSTYLSLDLTLTRYDLQGYTVEQDGIRITCYEEGSDNIDEEQV